MQIDAAVKNIIFDLGGVILNIDYSLTQTAFEKFGIKSFHKIYSQSVQQKLFDDFETGKIPAPKFRRELKKFIPREISDKEFDMAWNSMLLDLPPERIQILEKLKKKYRLFLLSNTNEIHFCAFSDYLQETFGFESMKHIFEKEYPSYKIGIRKPDKKVFELVLRENHLIAKETLFIDDSIQHIEGAKKIGMKTLFAEKAFDICSLYFGKSKAEDFI